MKFSCEKVFLQNAVNISSHTAAAKSSIPSLEGLLIDAGMSVTVSGYNLKTGIVTNFDADVEEQGAIILNAKLLCDIIRKLPDDVVTIDSDAKYMVRITCGMSDFSIMGIAPDEYPELPTFDVMGNIAIPQKTLKAMIRETSFAISTNEARPVHTGALFETENGCLTMVAVDGYRLALRKEALSPLLPSGMKFVVPGAALSEVEKIAGDTDEVIKISLGDKHIMFTIGTTLLLTRRLEGEFLNYRNAISSACKFRIEVARRELIDSIERVSLIISDKQKSPVRCTFEDGSVKVLTTTPLGKATDECAVRGDGEGLEIGFNNIYILEALKAAPADKLIIQLTSGVSPCIMVPADGTDSFLYMILPVRLRANEG